jgi:hypothetical protein
MALSINFHTSKDSTSTKIAFIRRLLLGELDEVNEITEVMKKVAKGELRLVVEVTKADIMAALVRLKREIAPKLKMTFVGAHESWMVSALYHPAGCILICQIADDLAKEDIGVVVAPSRSFPSDWDSHRILPGPPISNHTLPSYLASHGVKVALGIEENWQARNTRNDAAWIYANNPEVFSKQDAIGLVSKNLGALLGLDTGDKVEGEDSWVAWEGDWFSIDARVRGVKGAGSEMVDLF